MKLSPFYIQKIQRQIIDINSNIFCENVRNATKSNVFGVKIVYILPIECYNSKWNRAWRFLKN